MRKKLLFCDDAHTFGGAQKALKKLVELFSNENNYEVYVAISFKNKLLYDEFSDIKNIKLIDGYQVKKFSAITSHFDKKQYKTAKKIIDNINLNVALLNLSGIEFGINYSKALKISKVPYIAWLHNSTSFTTMLSNSPIKTKILSYIRDKIADNYLINSHGSLVLVSKSSYQEMIDRGSKKDCLTTIENPLPYIKNSILKERDKKFIIGVFGRIQYCHKGQDQIIKLLDKYKNQLSDVIFYIYGDGPDLQELSKNSHSNQLIIKGWTNEVTIEMQKCDLILIPSRFEGLSLVFLEAIALNKKILTSNISAFYLSHPEDIYELDNIENLFQKLIEKYNSNFSHSENETYYSNLKQNLSEENWFLKFKEIIKSIE